MASIQHSLVTPSPLCCCSHALLHPRTRTLSPRFPNGTFSTAKPFLRLDFLDGGGTLAWRMAGRRRLAVAGAGKGPFFGGGRRQRSTARTVWNLAFVALVAYLAVSGQFRWLLDAIVPLWDPFCSDDNGRVLPWRDAPDKVSQDSVTKFQFPFRSNDLQNEKGNKLTRSRGYLRALVRSYQGPGSKYVQAQSI